MRLLRSLVIDPRSLRALDETAVDRQLELARAATPLARSLCHLRSVLAVLRVFAMCMPREVAQSTLLLVAARGALFVIPAALALMVARQDILVGFRGSGIVIGVPWPAAITLMGGFAAMALEGAMPVAWFLAATWPLKRKLPVFALVTTVFIFSIVQNGWIVPLAQAYSPGLARLSATTTLTILFGGIYASHAAALALLGAAVARLTRTQRWIWRFAVPASLTVWTRAALWITGWERPTATLSSSIAMAGAGMLMVAIIGAAAFWLLARQATDEGQESAVAE
jgi:hypothetical protein